MINKRFGIQSLFQCYNSAGTNIFSGLENYQIRPALIKISCKEGGEGTKFHNILKRNIY